MRGSGRLSASATAPGGAECVPCRRDAASAAMRVSVVVPFSRRRAIPSPASATLGTRASIRAMATRAISATMRAGPSVRTLSAGGVRAAARSASAGPNRSSSACSTAWRGATVTKAMPWSGANSASAAEAPPGSDVA